jgi:endonuclease/exonuclease/phosphatase family metal-dependent hydrolase
MNKKYFRILLLSIHFFLTNVTAGGQDPPDSSRLVRVLTYNILHGATLKGDFDLDRIAMVIREADPDLVALQEVDFFTNRARGMDLATELGIRTAMAPLFGMAMPFDGGEYGEAILSRYSFLCTKVHALPAREGKEPRAALAATLVLKSGDTINFIGTHLDHTRDETDRINQANRLNRLFTFHERPAILAGDLNATPGSKTMEILFGKWTPSFPEYEPTFPSTAPTRKIDYILFRPARRWRVIERSVMDDKVASDHCPVLTVLELMEN